MFHQVTAVHSGREALVTLRVGATFDVILCDIMMPEMTGAELHEELARKALARAAQGEISLRGFRHQADLHVAQVRLARHAAGADGAAGVAQEAEQVELPAGIEAGAVVLGHAEAGEGDGVADAHEERRDREGGRGPARKAARARRG